MEAILPKIPHPACLAVVVRPIPPEIVLLSRAVARPVVAVQVQEAAAVLVVEVVQPVVLVVEEEDNY